MEKIYTSKNYEIFKLKPNSYRVDSNLNSRSTYVLVYTGGSLSIDGATIPEFIKKIIKSNYKLKK